MDSSPDRSGPKAWRLPALLVLLLAVVIAIRLGRTELAESAGSATSTAGSVPESAGATEKVGLLVDFGERAQGEREYGAIAWNQGMSVGDLLAHVARSDSSFKYEKSGSGQSAFLTEINGVSSEPGGSSFWLYWVNGKKAEVSMDLYQLQPGDSVLWKFAAPE